MSTIPGGCFVAPDSLRRLKQHARQAKLQQGLKPPGSVKSPTDSPCDSPIGSPIGVRRDVHFIPPTLDHSQNGPFAHTLTTAPMKLNKLFSRVRSFSTPQSTPPATPPLSPKMPRSASGQESLPIPIPKPKQDGGPVVQTTFPISIPNSKQVGSPPVETFFPKSI